MAKLVQTDRKSMVTQTNTLQNRGAQKCSSECTSNLKQCVLYFVFCLFGGGLTTVDSLHASAAEIPHDETKLISEAELD